eukprot:COSAG01_NODE_3461_length_6067_cov_55.078418_4_plen_89_part_00
MRIALLTPGSLLAGSAAAAASLVVLVAGKQECLAGLPARVTSAPRSTRRRRRAASRQQSAAVALLPGADSLRTGSYDHDHYGGDLYGV